MDRVELHDTDSFPCPTEFDWTNLLDAIEKLPQNVDTLPELLGPAPPPSPTPREV
jgi:hypothetical protein